MNKVLYIWNKTVFQYHGVGARLKPRSNHVGWPRSSVQINMAMKKSCDKTHSNTISFKSPSCEDLELSLFIATDSESRFGFAVIYFKKKQKKNFAVVNLFPPPFSSYSSSPACFSWVFQSFFFPWGFVTTLFFSASDCTRCWFVMFTDNIVESNKQN